MEMIFLSIFSFASIFERIQAIASSSVEHSLKLNP